MVDSFSKYDRLPLFLLGAIRVHPETAVQANVSRQNYSVLPHDWYVDADYRCPRCGEEFCFTVAEQRHWYEELGFTVDSKAKHCLACRRDLRRLKATKQEYDREIASTLCSQDIARKQRLITVIDELCEGGLELPEKIRENRRILAQQIAKQPR